ncbi:hypothetical protein WN944_010542 [Citrus x changshan-huyou]|uniref:Protein kinase domain-containing protein n=1 Tax=Citrus x changshan-huyou TaxID=2935761 RepID=A0AAP0MUA6_9ROSI
MSSEEASIFSTFLLFLLMFVFSTSEIEARKVEVQLCSSSYGDVKNISYPFRLKGDPAGCGHPELQLPCESNKIILEFNSGKYYVKRISYDKCTISVAEVNLANGSCSLPYKSFSLSAAYHDAFTKVPCLSDNQSNVYVYPGYAGINDKISDLPDVPVVLNRSVDNPSYEDLQKLLDSGLHQQCRSSGKDGFGSVYKGQLHIGGLIAVKMLENSNFSAVEFINEVSTIGRIHHVNVVQLLGFYSEGSKRALVYEYMPNGSLDIHIFPNEGRGKSFSWEKLHEVALGTARGIEYLHNG